MRRRDFLELSTAAAGALILPPGTQDWNGAITPIPTADKKSLATTALAVARDRGAEYADVRLGRYLNQAITTREALVQRITSTESYGVGIRVLAQGTWGFASSNTVTPESIVRTAERAVAVAKANARFQTEPVQLAPVPAYGDVTWKTPIERNAQLVPVAEKVDLLLSVNEAALKAGANFINSQLFAVNEQKYFASSDGSFIEQDIHRIWPTFTVTAVDPTSGRFQTRNALSAPIGLGYEYLQSGSALPGITPIYGNRYDMVEDATVAAAQAREKLSARSIAAGKWDLVLDPSHLFLTIHESVGHPLELDRVLGYEANYAGTSFATLDKWQSGTFKFGNEKVNFVADKTQADALGTVGWDDEGVQTRQWDLVRNGVLVNYQAIRDQVHILGQGASHGCCYADSWDSVQFQRMPNVSLQPNPNDISRDDLIGSVEKGIYIFGRGSYSIDQQRYNFQFGGQLFYEIANGKIVGMLNDVAYQSNTQEFWNAVAQLGGTSDYRLGGSFFDGKGQPGQVSAVSHGCPTTRFANVNVINTARRLR